MAANAHGIQLVVTDLAGTTVDYGSRAPAGAFVELFRRHGVDITDAEARGPMGLQKRDHIVALTRMPRIADAWRDKHGSDPDETRINELYAEFIALQVDCLPDYDDVIPGVLETVEALRARGIHVAATTGYNREMMEVVLKGAERQGFVPDAACCAEDVPYGRPAPWMIFRSMEAVGVYPPAAVLTIGDTIPDVESGRNAGTWTVGVTATGNMLGLSEAEAEALSDDELRPRLANATKALADAGAHKVVEAFADCLECIDNFEERLANGEQP